MDNYERKEAIRGAVEMILANSSTPQLRNRRFRVIEQFNYNSQIVGYMILMDGLPLTRDELWELNEMVHGAESQVDYSQTNSDFSNIMLVYYQAPPIDKKHTFTGLKDLGRPKGKRTTPK